MPEDLLVDVDTAPTDVWCIGRIVVIVEGRTLYEGDDPDGALDELSKGTRDGDRFEMFLDGQGRGLRIRSGDGWIEVPEDLRQAVSAMSPEQVSAMLTRATSAAGSKDTGGVPVVLAAAPFLLAALVR